MTYHEHISELRAVVSLSSNRDPHVVKAMDPADLVQVYRPFVGSIVTELRRQLRIRVPIEDLEGYAYEGLLDAQQRFDPEDGTYFVSYAYYRIRGAILDGCRTEGWLSRSQAQRARRLRGIDELLTSNAATERAAPRPQSFGEAVSRLADVVDAAATVFLLAEADVEILAPVAPNQEAFIEQRSNEVLVRRAFEVLTDQEREIVQRFHFDEESMDEIAASFRRSRSWVSRTNTRALDKMRKHLLGFE